MPQVSRKVERDRSCVQPTAEAVARAYGVFDNCGISAVGEERSVAPDQAWDERHHRDHDDQFHHRLRHDDERGDRESTRKGQCQRRHHERVAGDRSSRKNRAAVDCSAGGPELESVTISPPPRRAPDDEEQT